MKKKEEEMKKKRKKEKEKKKREKEKKKKEEEEEERKNKEEKEKEKERKEEEEERKRKEEEEEIHAIKNKNNNSNNSNNSNNQRNMLEHDSMLNDVFDDFEETEIIFFGNDENKEDQADENKPLSLVTFDTPTLKENTPTLKDTPSKNYKKEMKQLKKKHAEELSDLKETHENEVKGIREWYTGILQKRLNEYKKDTDQYHTELDDFRVQNTKISKSLKKKEKKLKKHKERCKDLENEIDRMQGEQKTLLKEAKTLREEIKRLRNSDSEKEKDKVVKFYQNELFNLKDKNTQKIKELEKKFDIERKELHSEIDANDLEIKSIKNLISSGGKGSSGNLKIKERLIDLENELKKKRKYIKNLEKKSINSKQNYDRIIIGMGKKIDNLKKQYYHYAIFSVKLILSSQGSLQNFDLNEMVERAIRENVEERYLNSWIHKVLVQKNVMNKKKKNMINIPNSPPSQIRL